MPQCGESGCWISDSRQTDCLLSTEFAEFSPNVPVAGDRFRLGHSTDLRRFRRIFIKGGSDCCQTYTRTTLETTRGIDINLLLTINEARSCRTVWIPLARLCAHCMRARARSCRIQFQMCVLSHIRLSRKPRDSTATSFALPIYHFFFLLLFFSNRFIRLQPAERLVAGMIGVHFENHMERHES